MIELIGVIVAFAIIFPLTLKKVNLGLVLLLASVIIGVTAGLGPEGFLNVARETVTDYTTYELIFSVALISALGNCLKETGLMTSLIENLRGFCSSRFLIALIPAIFGLLPMPGGALMSAPFNDGEASRLGLNAEEKTYVNVWFRHVWFFASPVSSTTILISRLAGVNLYQFLLVLFPLFFISAFVGYLFSLRRLKSPSNTRCKPSYSTLAKGLGPIVLAIVLNIVGVPLPLAILVGVFLVLLEGRIGLRNSLMAVRRGIHMDVLTALAGVMFFRYMIYDSGSVTQVFSGLKQVGVPLLLLATVFPLLIGFISGTPQSGIGIGVPLILPLFTSPSTLVLGLIYLSIVIGYLMSPLHLCLLLTNSYYKSGLGKVYRTLVPSVLVLYAIGLPFFILRI